MFEVGKKPISTWQAHIASLLSPPHDRNSLDEPRRGPRAATRRWRRALAVLATAMVIPIALAGASLTEPGRAARQRLAKLANVDLVAGRLGFGIDQVTLTGQKFTFDRDVFDVLDLANARSYASFDAKAAKDRIERLPWVATAELTRVYPDRLDIRIRERTPFAVWARGEQTYLIDATGRVLSAVSGALPPSLPRIAGEGAAAEAGAFFDLVGGYPDIYRRFETAVRVGERRWTLKLADEVTLELPADGEAQVLNEISRDPGLKRAIERGHTTLDFRAPGRIALRKVATPSAQGVKELGSKEEPRS